MKRVLIWLRILNQHRLYLGRISF
ncbi:hypothetical protein Gohar_009075 [Gossypium harknessii]|uniref:Uncharacterized protein n=1 Tax=Gossypium harknessii TaxID=34285 RepID=A0A7J9GLN4_9ROSI|nr:hypothetical protein [Gossypium harknessii]